eukprot:CAMPEP_0170160564 /NCGR_PEP_ID=MMETSP0033_2-20121228/73793_1 /TAXON_ID=195969 /ORGANISM="Dolichomastix tenuilepis, Strain CCMP3274" /LENGTH=289 /DNA_ID=CAMNT_0010398119 /DNA_START=17 /DNA_END=886 /DNA_ORIENTATION=+
MYWKGGKWHTLENQSILGAGLNGLHLSWILSSNSPVSYFPHADWERAADHPRWQEGLSHQCGVLYRNRAMVAEGYTHRYVEHIPRRKPSDNEALDAIKRLNIHSKLQEAWPGDDPNRWTRGITTNEHGRVTKLILADMNLTALPIEIGNLLELKELWCQKNRLTVVPGEIGCLAKLKGLGFGFNRITRIPDEIANLRQLSHKLSFRSNRLTATALESICRRSAGQTIAGTCPPRDIFGARLKELDLRGNQNLGALNRLFKGQDAIYRVQELSGHPIHTPPERFPYNYAP